MSESRSESRNGFRWFAVSLGIALLAYLVLRTGPAALWHEVRSVGYGITIILVLGGLSHLVKVWAWRRTFTCDISHLSLPRSFAMRLASEAIGQLGIAGKVVGEGVRVSLLGSAVPAANAVSAAALDSVLYILTSVVVAIVAILTSLLVAPLPGKLRIYALLFSAVFAALLILVAVAVGRGWRAMGAVFKAIERVPGCKAWVSRKQQVIDSTERNLLNFHREAPAGFRAALLLNFCAHGLAVSEIYVVLRFLTPKATVLGAFVLEGLTKLINFVGAINPGNVGTYEGGNMLIGKLFGLTATAGLTLALCRRARALFWTAIGALCLMVMRRPDKGKSELKTNMTTHGHCKSTEPASPLQSKDSSTAVIILADWGLSAPECSPSLARVATLPLLLRNILAVRAAQPSRIAVCVPSTSAERIKSALSQTGRMPFVEWNEIQESDLVPALAEAAATSERIVLVLGNRSYQPRLLQSAIEWEGSSCLALASDGDPAGVYVLPQAALVDLADSSLDIQTPGDLHSWLLSRETVEVLEVPSDSWQRIDGPDDLSEAERKLDSWLIKPTDGIYARMNRRVSTPISRQLIKYPITPNMVTFFVLGVSFACGVFYARGGYWNCLIAALLSVAGSILDGCDGEVARFKLQSTRLGCWLDSVCDYLYYLFAFGGMAVGLTRISGSHSYLVWGGVLLSGAVATFLIVSFSRQRLAGTHPEKFLAIWQKKAESRSSNPLLYFGRQTEFIVRRCFHPYALVFFALVGATNVVFIGAAIGANIAWLIALYSYVAFSRRATSRVAPQGATVISPDASA